MLRGEQSLLTELRGWHHAGVLVLLVKTAAVPPAVLSREKALDASSCGTGVVEHHAVSTRGTAGRYNGHGVVVVPGDLVVPWNHVVHVQLPADSSAKCGRNGGGAYQGGWCQGVGGGEAAAAPAVSEGGRFGGHRP